ncbi:MerR family transcriptional regulator [Moritella dasanensis]|uniref:MerR family transcriptional regulator n=1 Tax=Moritella dasanensis TaxID=428031 RepID=UPI0003122FA5|nr:MerR family transcriptional regulator [Moritella dasanensis]
MYKISELAQKVNLSRTTLLYYEKLGLISSKRQANGYRSYSEFDLQRVKLLQQLQAGGLSLKECQACLEAKINREQLLQRLQTLDEDIAQKQKSRELLSSMLGMSSMRDWHQATDKHAPSAHLDWLMTQGFSEKQALRLKWLSKDMNNHEQYMREFEFIFDGLDRLGPSSTGDAIKALSSIPVKTGELLEIGCGKGVTTIALAKHTQFAITGLDNDEYNLSCLKEHLGQQLSLNKSSSLEPARPPSLQQIELICASMTDMPFSDQQFDVIWSEGSAYIMGVKQALESWKPFIKQDGYLVVSDLVWLTDSPDDEVQQFWLDAYPDMASVASRQQMIEDAGYQVVDSYTLSQASWDNYLQPLQQKVAQLEDHVFVSLAFADLQKELTIHRQYLGQYGYQMFVLKLRN